MTLENTMTCTHAGPVQTVKSDQDLRLYADGGDADAFTRLVGRYVNLVYTLCVRQLGDAHLAEDVTQAVFILLARKARSLRPTVVLSGWLFDASRYCCANARRAQSRRTHYETEAAKQRPETVQHATASLEQEEMGQVLHRALGRLNARTRQVVLLRYFEQRSIREVGNVLGVSEEAAKHRIARAVDKLRQIMLREEVGTAALVSQSPQWIEQHALLVPPEHLAACASQVALSGTGAAASTTAIAKAASAAMSWAKMQIVLMTIAACVVGGAGVILLAQQLAQPAAPVQLSSATTAPAPLAVLLDQSSPLQTLRSLGRCIAATDENAATQCLLLSDDDQSRMIAAGLRLNVAQLRLQQTLTRHFGSEAPRLALTDIPVAQFIDEGLARLGPADEQIDADKAVVTVKIDAEVLAKVPQAHVYQGMPLYFVRDASGKWIFDASATVAMITLDTRNMPHRADPRLGTQFWNALAEGAELTISEIEAGALVDPRRVQSAFLTHIAECSRKSASRPGALPIPPSLNTMVIPKGLAEKLPSP
jgi:RNA polymerase sigma factor (sigma-70 family)